MKIFFNRFPRNEPYGGGNQFLQRMTDTLAERGHKVVYHFEHGIDAIFMMDPRPRDHGYSAQHVFAYKQDFPKVKILHRINECDKRKATQHMDDLLIRSAQISDEVVFISEWLQKYFYDLGLTNPSHTIYNGCDTNIFMPSKEQKIGEKVRLVTHHWSDNWMKGFDLYTQIDKQLIHNPSADFEFSYIGRYSKEYTPTATNLVSPRRGQSLADTLKQHHIYVTASRWEPCGMHHIEGAACGLPVLYHRDSGGIKELCQNHGLEFSNFSEFLEGLQEIKRNYSAYVDRIDRDKLSIDVCCEKFSDIVENMVRS